MNSPSSRSHCVYLFTIQQDSDKDRRAKPGKLILADLAGSEEVGKTGAAGRVFEEADTINKSLLLLGKAINSLTSGSSCKANQIPYCDSKLPHLLQDALGGKSRMALLCCCSPSTLNASETLSTLRFGMRAKQWKIPENKTDIRKSWKADLMVQKQATPKLLPGKKLLCKQSEDSEDIAEDDHLDNGGPSG